METLFLEAPFAEDVELCPETLSYLKKFKKVALYSSVQFVSKLDRVKEQLQEIGVEYVTSRADRAAVKTQLLGCDSFSDSLNLKEEFEAYLYIGDGKFHPLALVYAQKDLAEVKEIVCNDPIHKKMFLVSLEDVKSNLSKYKASLIKFLGARKVGVIITIKPGQEQFKASKFLEKKFPNKEFYYFIDNSVSFDQLENFNFIDTWINTTCPRVGFDDQEKFKKGVLNLNDAYLAEQILGKDSVLNKKGNLAIFPSNTRR